jgi:hypothetical protein
MTTEQNNKDQESSVLEKEIVRIVDETLKNRMIELASSDIKVIAKQIMPNLDKMIAKHMKNHFYEFGLYLQKKFEEKK